MKKGDVAYGLLSAAMLVAGGWIIWLKYFREPPAHFVLLQDVAVSDLGGQLIPFSELMDKTATVHCLVFTLEDCDPCLFQGIEELTNLMARGEHGFALLVNDWQEEAVSWSKHYDFPIYRVARSDFYQGFRTDSLPVIAAFRDHQVVRVKRILPE